jgi:ATP-dependent RNA/DNA helicase IGHMBP2
MVCFGGKEPSFVPPATFRKPFNQSLDPSQRLAVAKAQSAVEIALIHGPPGTGKSTTLVEIVLQAKASGKRVSHCPCVHS